MRFLDFYSIDVFHASKVILINRYFLQRTLFSILVRHRNLINRAEY